MAPVLSSQPASLYREGQISDDLQSIVANLNGLGGQYLVWVPNGGEAAAAGVSQINSSSGTPLPIMNGVVTLPVIPPAIPVVNDVLSFSTTSALAANQGRVLSANDIASMAVAGSNLIVTLKGGGTVSADISALQLDVKLVSAAYNAATKMIVFTLSDASTISMPASALLPVATDGTTITGEGNITPLAVKVSPRAGNALTATAAGLDVVLPAAVAPITADNGLTKNANNIALGGALLAPTTVTTTATNTLAIAGLVANATPTDFVTRDSAGKLTQSSLSAIVGNARYGLIAPVAAPTDKRNDTFIQNSTGTAAGLFVAEWVFDGTAWYKTTISAPDDIVDVTGATLPIAFPVTTIPGAPVFNPPTPANVAAIYAITDGATIAYAKWTGTQFVSAPAPMAQPNNGHFRSGTGTVLPNGVNDPTENISRIGKTAFGLIDPTVVNASVDVAGTLATRMTVLTNTTAAIAISRLSAEASSSIKITQTVADAILIFEANNTPAYLLTLNGRHLRIHNDGNSTNKITYSGFDIYPGKYLDLHHDGRRWDAEVQYAEDWEGFATAISADILVPAFTTALTSDVDVPGAQFAAPAPGDYLVWYTMYASCNGGINPGVARNDFKFATNGAIIPGSEIYLDDAVPNAISPYTRFFRARVTAAGQIVKMLTQSNIGGQITYQSATQVSKINWRRYNPVPLANAANFTTSADTRSINGTPESYATGDYTELKDLIAIGLLNTPAALASIASYPAGVFAKVRTVRAYGVGSDLSGGRVRQDAYTDDARSFYRLSATATTWGGWYENDMQQSRFMPNDNYNGVLCNGNIPPVAQVFALADANFANPLTLPPITNQSEPITVTSNAGLTSAIAPTNRVAGSVALPIATSQQYTFLPNPAGWQLDNGSLTNGANKSACRGTYAAPLTGAITIFLSDYGLIVANASVSALPAPASSAGRTIWIKKAGSVVGSAALTGSVDGVANAVISNTNEAVWLYCDGATWVRY